MEFCARFDVVDQRVCVRQTSKHTEIWIEHQRILFTFRKIWKGMLTRWQIPSYCATEGETILIWRNDEQTKGIQQRGHKGEKTHTMEFSLEFWYRRWKFTVRTQTHIQIRIRRFFFEELPYMEPVYQVHMTFTLIQRCSRVILLINDTKTRLIRIILNCYEFAESATTQV